MTTTIRSCWIVADDLSGAGDCAAAFAAVTGPVPLYLGAAPRNAAETSWPACVAIDTDSRAMDVRAALAATARAFEPLGRGDLQCDLIYKKIDSTLRGHLAAELEAALQALPQGAGSIVAPAFPEQGRTLVGGHLRVHGRPAEHLGHSGDLVSMLATSGLRPVLLDQRPGEGPAVIVHRITLALANGARTLVADASGPDDLARIAAALCSPGAPRLLVAGSAGLAHALAAHVGPRSAAPARAPVLPAGPVLAIVGSFSPACAAQVQALESSGEAQVIRFSAAQWLDEEHAALRESGIAAARDTLRGGGHVLFAIGGEVVQPFSRSLVEAMARATAPLLTHAGLCVLTGGDTARVMFNELGIGRFDVAGEFEPGISIGRAGAAGRFVLKAGGFGDRLALQRIIRHCGRQRRATAGSPEDRPRDFPGCQQQRARWRLPEESSSMQRPIVLITMGDPTGVGPEVIAKSVNQGAVQRRLRPLVIGDSRRLQQAIAITGEQLAVHSIDAPQEAVFEAGTIDCLDLHLVPPDLPFGKLSAVGGEAAYRFIARAAQLAQSGVAGAICTAPLNKEALHAAGHRYPGHTEMLAHLSGTPEVSMLLVAPRLRVIHVTTHVGLIDAIARIEPGLVERTIRRGAELLVRAGLPKPRIAVCGINPHAGEGGLFGRGEEEEKIAPAVAACVRGGLDVQGPLPADTLFFRATRGDFDLIVAMYHDQGHGPVKVLGLEAGVNVTVGLPFVRTSVDHGTAFDLAGTGRADPGSMVAALELAAEFAPRA